MRHFYNQEGREDINLVLEQWFSCSLFGTGMQLLIKWSQLKS